jgi:cell division inhibitor SulA
MCLPADEMRLMTTQPSTSENQSVTNATVCSREMRGNSVATFTPATVALRSRACYSETAPQCSPLLLDPAAEEKTRARAPTRAFVTSPP